MSSQSNLADVVRLLDRLTEDECRQLHGLLSVKLGLPITVGGQKSTAGKKVAAVADRRRGGSGTPKGANGKAVPKKKKGNPQRKSQYSTHPLYTAYIAAKKAAEAKSKADKVRFADLTGEVADNYALAFTQWMNAKSSFRRSEKSAQSETQPEGSVAASAAASVPNPAAGLPARQEEHGSASGPPGGQEDEAMQEDIETAPPDDEEEELSRTALGRSIVVHKPARGRTSSGEDSSHKPNKRSRKGSKSGKPGTKTSGETAQDYQGAS